MRYTLEIDGQRLSASLSRQDAKWWRGYVLSVLKVKCKKCNIIKL